MLLYMYWAATQLGAAVAQLQCAFHGMCELCIEHQDTSGVSNTDCKYCSSTGLCSGSMSADCEGGHWVDKMGPCPAYKPVRSGHCVAPDETVILLHPPLHLVGLSTVMERERQQNDSLANGYHHHCCILIMTLFAATLQSMYPCLRRREQAATCLVLSMHQMPRFLNSVTIMRWSWKLISTAMFRRHVPQTCGKDSLLAISWGRCGVGQRLLQRRRSITPIGPGPDVSVSNAI